MSRLIYSIFLVIGLTLFTRCSSSDDSSDSVETQLEDIVTELIFFNYTPQDGNTPERLQYEISFTNNNNVGVKGFYGVSTIAFFGTEQIESTMLSTNLSECHEIEANTTCTYSFDETGDINLGLVTPDSIEFISASYTIDSSF